MRNRATHQQALAVLAATVLLAAGCASSGRTGASDRPAPAPRSGDTMADTDRPESGRTGAEDGRIDIENLSLEQLNRMGLLQDIHFDFDKYNLRPDAVRTLRSNADFLRGYQTVQVLIEGHCDERGTNEYNLALGERRADAARDYLARVGIRGDRMSTVSFGEERPLDPGHDEAAWARNRRAHFRIVAK